jgi:hypothetical protein
VVVQSRICSISLPVGHILERQRLDRGTGDDEAVELAVLYLVPGVVEIDQVIFRGVLGHMRADAHQRQLHLQRRRPDQPCNLCLGGDLVRHQVQQPDVKGTDILPDGNGFIHDLHAFAHKRIAGGKTIGNTDRHDAISSNKKPAANFTLPVRWERAPSAI